MKKITIYLLTLVLLTSCTIYGLTNDYKKLSETDKLRVEKLESFDNLEGGKIYEINAEQLKTELRKHPKSIVRIFTNYCNAPTCYPISVFKTYAEQNDYKIFFVMTGYADVNKTLVQDSTIPYFSIDADYYQTKYRNRYVNCFENELMGLDKNTKQKEWLGDLFFFENGNLVKVYKDLPI